MTDTQEKVCLEEERFQHPWSKLDKGSKLNRLSLYTKMEKVTHDLSDTQEQALKIQVTQLFSCGHLNRNTDVDYNTDEMKITKITGIIMTKLDGTAKGGILLAIGRKFKIPIIALGMGEKEDDLHIFSAQHYSNALMAN